MIKKILIFIGIVVILIVAVTFFSKKDKNTTSSSLLSSSGENVVPSLGDEEVGEEFLLTLLNLRTIQLDDSIFSDQDFRSLQDFTITLIPEGNVGRPNPFAPIGTDVSTTTTTTTIPAPFTNTTTTTSTSTSTQSSPVTPPSGEAN